MDKVQVKIKKTNENAVMPKYAIEGDAGLDLTAVSEYTEDGKDYGFIEYGIGLAFEIPKGFFGCIRPRSSISKTGLILANAPCTLDSGFRGEFKVRFKWIKGTKKYEIGDRIAQLIVLPYPEVEFIEVEELEQSVRGEGQFGSSGN